MTISVLADASGAIIATLRPAELPSDCAVHIRRHAQPGQSVHNVTLPEELSHLRSLVSLHHTHRLIFSGGEARLVRSH